MKKFSKIISLILSVMLLLSISVVSSYAAGENAPFRINCTINGDTGTQRGFCWYTKSETDTKVEISILGVPVNSAKVEVVGSEKFEGNYYHKAVVSGLTAGITYGYRVGDGNVWSDYGYFTTDNGDDIVNFIAVADVQASVLDRMEKGANVLDKALDHQIGTDFVVNLGDFTNDSTNEEWDLYDQCFGDMNLTYSLVPVAGNHDSNANWFNNLFTLDTSESVTTKNGVNYSFEVGNCHFAVLNTNDNIAISKTQLTWLKNDMNSTDKDWKIVFLHKAPYSLGKDAKWPDMWYIQKYLTAVCDETNVDLVMSGHDHMYLRTKALKNQAIDEDGTTYVLAGTAGDKRYEIRKFLGDTFMKKDLIANLVVQKDGYANCWDDENNSWDEVNLNNVGGCFNTVSIVGTTLTLNSYIVKDLAEGEEDNIITNTDTYTRTKAAGENEITFTGDNTVPKQAYLENKVIDFIHFATYTLTEWLGNFMSMLPAILQSVIVEDTF